MRLGCRSSRGSRGRSHVTLARQDTAGGIREVAILTTVTAAVAAAAAGRFTAVVHVDKGGHPALSVGQHDTVVVIEGRARVKRTRCLDLTHTVSGSAVVGWCDNGVDILGDTGKSGHRDYLII